MSATVFLPRNIGVNVSSYVGDDSMAIVFRNEILDLGWRSSVQVVSSNKVVGNTVLLEICLFAVIDRHCPLARRSTIDIYFCHDETGRQGRCRRSKYHV